MAEIDVKIVAEVDKNQRAKLMNQIMKEKEKMIEEEADTFVRKQLIDIVLDKKQLTADDIKIMRNNEYYKSEIKLSLVLIIVVEKIQEPISATTSL